MPGCLLVYLFICLLLLRRVARRRQALHAASLLHREHTALAPGLGSKSKQPLRCRKKLCSFSSVLQAASSRLILRHTNYVLARQAKIGARRFRHHYPRETDTRRFHILRSVAETGMSLGNSKVCQVLGGRRVSMIGI